MSFAAGERRVQTRPSSTSSSLALRGQETSWVSPSSVTTAVAGALVAVVFLDHHRGERVGLQGLEHLDVDALGGGPAIGERLLGGRHERAGAAEERLRSV